MIIILTANASCHLLGSVCSVNRRLAGYKTGAVHCRGVYTRGEWCQMHHGENWGRGNVVMIMMLLLVSIIIYYYMNTFITLHQCTFNLLFALFSTLCLKKTTPMFLAITRERIVGFS